MKLTPQRQNVLFALYITTICSFACIFSLSAIFFQPSCVSSDDRIEWHAARVDRAVWVQDIESYVVLVRLHVDNNTRTTIFMEFRVGFEECHLFDYQFDYNQPVLIRTLFNNGEYYYLSIQKITIEEYCRIIACAIDGC